jgi:hypothetical protein
MINDGGDLCTAPKVVFPAPRMPTITTVASLGQAATDEEGDDVGEEEGGGDTRAWTSWRVLRPRWRDMPSQKEG